MNLNGDFKEFLELLIDQPVKFLLVGAQALAVHGRPRFTGDLDVWIERSHDNALRLVMALDKFGFGGLDPQPFTEFDRLATLGREPVRIDIFTHIPGPPFADAYTRKVLVPFGKRKLPVLSKQDLIETKEASGRPRDLLDLELLKEID